MYEDHDEAVASLHDGNLRLWLAVTLDAFKTLQFNPSNMAAASWLFDPNELFDYVSDALGCEPDYLRHRIRQSLARRSARMPQD